MRISVFGLGYVGAVTAACLAAEGHDVVGVDRDRAKVASISSGASPVLEERLDELIAAATAVGCLRATDDVPAAIRASDLALVCVGTPSDATGGLDLRQLADAAGEIGAALAERPGFFVVAIRSTVLPGTTRRVLVPLLEAASGKVLGRDFGVCVNPEFLREGKAVADFQAPSKVVVGASDERSGDLLTSVVARPEAPLFQTDIRVAEMTKYVDNAWHALKVAFANEIGSLGRAHGIDGRTLMQIFCADRTLNLSPAYLDPGFAFGGSCLPKDLRALTADAHSAGVRVPLLESILPSNQQHLERGYQLITEPGGRKVGVLGLSFKAGTDDVRESPMVALVDRLVESGHDVRVYDAGVARRAEASRLDGAAHLAPLFAASADEVLDHGDTVVVGTRAPEFAAALAHRRDGQVVVDLVHLAEAVGEGYSGLCW